MNQKNEFQKMIQHVFEEGIESKDRTNVGTLSTFGPQFNYNVENTFPLFTDKKTWFKGIAVELLWFLGATDEKYAKFGNSNIKYLVDNNVKIWDDWPYKKYKESVSNALSIEEFRQAIKEDENFAFRYGDLGPIYGKQWLSWGERGYNQIDKIIDQLKNNPFDRGIIVSAWNAQDLDKMALRPCHTMFQIYARPRKGETYLSLKLYQRSADLMLGVPFNVASYTLLLYMLSHVLNMKPYKFIHTFGDLHIYSNHIEAANGILKRDPIDYPTLEIKNRRESIYDFRLEDFEIKGYRHYPSIKLEVAV